MKANCFPTLYSSMAPPGGNSKPLIIQPLKANTSSADPAQAALILLLAGKVSKGSKDQNKALFNGIVKQMTNGVNASEILRSIIKPQQHEDLIQAAINAAAFTEDKGQPEPQPKSDKCPLLTELLYKSFQARLAKEQRMKALKEQQESSQTSSYAANRRRRVQQGCLCCKTKKQRKHCPNRRGKSSEFFDVTKNMGYKSNIPTNFVLR